VQLEAGPNENAVMDAMWVPASPLPDLSLPDMDDDEQTSSDPVAVSVKVTLLLLLPEKPWPGVTDQVVAVAARAAVPPEPSIKAATQAMMIRVLVNMLTPL